jgi:hypothetical protein
MKLPEGDRRNSLNGLKFGFRGVHKQADRIDPCRQACDQLGSNIGRYSPGAWWVKDKTNSVHTCGNSSINVGWVL